MNDAVLRAISAEADSAQGRQGGERDEHGLARVGQVLGAVRAPRLPVEERFEGRVLDVEDGQLRAGVHEFGRHGQAHVADAEIADGGGGGGHVMGSGVGF